MGRYKQDTCTFPPSEILSVYLTPSTHLHDHHGNVETARQAKRAKETLSVPLFNDTDSS